MGRVSTRPPGVRLSVVVPVYDEVECLPRLLVELTAVLDGLAMSTEIVMVDDGSTDGSFKRFASWPSASPACAWWGSDRNYGQTAALAAGFEAARGEMIVSLDADLQNDPRDLPLSAGRARRRRRRGERLAARAPGRVPHAAGCRRRSPTASSPR